MKSPNGLSPSSQTVANATAWVSPEPCLRYADESGLVWVFITTAADTWRRAWDGVPVPPGNAEVSRMYLRSELLRKTVVEVVDPASRRVIKRADIPGTVIPTMPGNRIAVYQEDRNGVPTVSVLRFSIRR